MMYSICTFLGLLMALCRYHVRLIAHVEKQGLIFVSLFIGQTLPRTSFLCPSLTAPYCLFLKELKQVIFSFHYVVTAWLAWECANIIKKNQVSF
jgi:hypothetical protein